MNVSRARRARTAKFALCAGSFLLVSLVAQQVQATTFQVVRIEEDWELTVSTPEPNSNSPQVTCAMLPSGSDAADYMTFELNHQTLPSYSSGGLHLHAWNGDDLIGSVHTQNGNHVEDSDDHVTWTSAVSLEDDGLVYEICNGNSTTWGSFGYGELRLAIPSQLNNLHHYELDASITGSGVGFGANRVTSLTLKRVRFITDQEDVLKFELNYHLVNSAGE